MKHLHCCLEAVTRPGRTPAFRPLIAGVSDPLEERAEGDEGKTFALMAYLQAGQLSMHSGLFIHLSAKSSLSSEGHRAAVSQAP